ncbi:DctP family TRAP transporter solute-binding subunit [Deferribacter autotrophicus]|uniref:DctP family TRAP transporter solute-binding subunit n=1 Tax=Deferribacter autotrophicus TaxID=500465 RepID=A0A5A8F5W8_9BACT|nr:DctP family TRAP transporter solute-binding subunit [Deferribacter autotrophicus]KAA0259447.1 DctP family TRAP transporter solute-binding subunit [Deferribacter autotrophicus]
MKNKVLLIISLFFLCNGIAWSQLVLKISHVVKNNSPKGKAVIYFKKIVEKESKGAIKVEIYPEGILFDDREALGALKNGLIQFAVPSFSKFADIVPEFQIYDIPYLFKNIQHVHRSYFGKIGNLLKSKSYEKGYKLLAMWDNGFKVITNNKRKIKYPQDLKGLKIRTQGSKVINKSLEIVGAVPVSKPFKVVVDLLKAGLIDGQQNTYNNIYTQQFFKYQKYLTITNNGFLGYVFISSVKFWENLDIKSKEIILNALEKATIYEYELAEEINYEDYYRIIIHSNIEIIPLNDREKKIWEDFYYEHYNVFYEFIDKKIVDEVFKLE